MKIEHSEVIIIGAGAAGLMCALNAGYRGRQVRVLDHARQAGRKILMSGGGRCNFTNLNATPANYLSANPHFCISALKRYRPQDFVELVDRHGLEYHEKSPGQLFCDHSSKDILAILLTECEWAGVDIQLQTSIEQVHFDGQRFILDSQRGRYSCDSLVVASGGLSIPTMGASGFGYDLARQFGLQVLPVRAALVPFTLQPEQKALYAPLSGLSTEVEVHCRGKSFREPMLFTHRGISGPAMLQISTYWEAGDSLSIDFFPGQSAFELFKLGRQQHPRAQLSTLLSQLLPKRLGQTLAEQLDARHELQSYSDQRLKELAERLHSWQIKPGGTEGYRTAEVTLGGVDTRALSSKTMAVNALPQLYFIGEVVDVTGELGGYNFQWAWASAVAAAQAV